VSLYRRERERERERKRERMYTDEQNKTRIYHKGRVSVCMSVRERRRDGAN